VVVSRNQPEEWKAGNLAGEPSHGGTRSATALPAPSHASECKERNRTSSHRWPTRAALEQRRRAAMALGQNPSCRRVRRSHLREYRANRSGGGGRSTNASSSVTNDGGRDGRGSPYSEQAAAESSGESAGSRARREEDWGRRSGLGLTDRSTGSIWTR
jgi:hypothetical protein